MAPATDVGDRSKRPSGRDALLLGLMHGPAELLPISSSGHVTLIAWLTNMPYSRLDSDRRKTIEVALHAGTAAALALAPPSSPVAMPARTRSLMLSAATLGPTAAIGFLTRRAIRSSLGTPGTVAAGLAAGSAVLLAADSRPTEGGRKARDLKLSDCLTVGVVQSASLWPGVSRSAMAIAAARMLGFDPGDSARIARSGIVPSSFAAASLEGIDSVRAGRLAEDSRPAAIAAGGAFVSALLARPLARRLESGGRLWPWALLRCLTATAAALRIRSLSDHGER